ncbi:MAG: hypothetical protein J6I54_00560 [Bacteroidaceae bacterium]|nr:hypothetical protein [Bacteroidaceae bacterium]
MDKKSYGSHATGHSYRFEYDAGYIIGQLQKNKCFCKSFFYGTRSDRCNISRIRRKIIREMKDIYHVTIKDYEFNTIVYETLIGEKSDWDPLKSYDKQSSFFFWLYKVARNAILKHVEKEHLVPISRYHTVGNTRLALLSQSVGMCLDVLDEMMSGSEYYPILHAIYVERKSAEDIQKMLNMTKEDYMATRRNAECILKDRLLRSSSCYVEDVLRSKKPNIIHVSSDVVAELAELYNTKSGENPLKDVFGTNLSEEGVKDRVMAFLYDFSGKLGWKEEDCYLWRKRFMENVSPVRLAEELDRTRGWVDTRYSRLNKRFNKAIREWWKKNT